MPSTFFGLDIGTTGLNTYQAALHTTAHNITNAATEGYSRQVVNRRAKDPISVAQSYGMAGTGVLADRVSQLRDGYYDLKYRTANTVYGEFSSREYYLKQIQNFLNEVQDGGFNKTMKSFFNGLHEVEKNPTSSSARTQLMNLASSFTDFFNSTARNLKKIQEETNFAIKNTADTINNYGEQIAALTKQINVIESNGGFANDLRDQRNLLVDKLSELVNVSTKEETIGDKDSGVTSYTVKVNGRYLVNNYTSNKIETVPRKTKTGINDVDGLYDLKWSDGQNFDLYNTQLGGKLASLVDIRDGNNTGSLRGKTTVNRGDNEITVSDSNINSIEDMNFPPEGKLTVGNQEYEYTEFSVKTEKDPDTGKVKYTYTFKLKEGQEVVSDQEDVDAKIGQPVNFKGVPYYLNRLNNFVRKFSKEFNELHKKGEDLNGEKGTDFFNGIDNVSGENYKFKGPGVLDEDGNEEDEFTSNDPTYYKLTAENYSVTKEIKRDVNKIAAASTIAEGIENTDIIKKLEALQNDKRMFDDGKPEEFYQSLTSDIGVDTKTTGVFTSNQKKLVHNINNQRLSISGVDKDEEATDLVRFKKCYDLSAKVITVMNEIYNKLINEMAV